MNRPNQPKEVREILPLTGIRGYASILVVFFHFFPTWTVLVPSLHLLRPLALRGYLGVDLFFLLSGFILSYVYQAGARRMSGGNYGSFLWFRLARIFPVHLATLAVLALMVGVAQIAHVSLTGDYPWPGIPYQLTLTHTWPFAPGGGWNYPSWSISAEWFAYLTMFPLAAFLLRRRWTAVTCLFVSAALLGIQFYITAQSNLNEFHNLTRVSCEFLAGSLFFGIFRESHRWTTLCQKAASWLCMAMLAALLLPTDWHWVDNTLILVFPFIILSLTSEQSKVAFLFSSPWSLWLGRISYALYMSHAIVQKVLKIVIPVERVASMPLSVRSAIFIGNIALLLLCAALLYYFVEVPARNFLRQVANRWQQSKKTTHAFS